MTSSKCKFHVEDTQRSGQPRFAEAGWGNNEAGKQPSEREGNPGRARS